LFYGDRHGSVAIGESPALPIYGIFHYLRLHSLKKNYYIERGNTYGEDLFLSGQRGPPSKVGMSLADPNFAGSPLLMRAWLDLEHINSAW